MWLVESEMEQMSDEVVHVAGVDLQFNSEDGSQILRQRCSWCGTTLIDIDLSRVSVPVGQEGSYPTWEVGAMVGTFSPDSKGGMWAKVDWEPGTPVPDDCCLRMPPDLTC